MVEPVRLVQIDVIGLEATKRRLAALLYVLAAEAPVVDADARRPEHLGADLQAFSALSGERRAHDRFGPGPRIDIGGIEGGDALVERLVDGGNRSVIVDLGAVGDPVAVRDGRDLQARSAQVAMFHDAAPSRWWDWWDW